MKKISSIFLAICLLFVSTPALADHDTIPQEFDPGFIISDADLFATGTMSVEAIQAFLNEQPGLLKDHVEPDIDGLMKTAAMIIHDAAQRRSINPKALIVLLQKEQSLITDNTPKDTQFHWATGYAVCDDCDVDHPFVQKFKGFAKQVDSAAEFLQYVPVNLQDFHFTYGETYSIDGQDVLIQNSATAALYNYTPHIHGNLLFYKIWQKWFATSLTYPSGTLLQAFGSPGVWLIKDGKKHAFHNISSLTSRYSLNQIIQVPPAVLEAYSEGPYIAYPESSLLRVASGEKYLLINNQLRLITDQATFMQLGFFEDEIEDVAESALAFFEEGTPITVASLEPIGALVQDPNSFGIFFVQDGVKYPLIAPELLSLNYPSLIARKGTVEELERYVKGAPVKLKDGLLVKSANSPSVYVIANGMKHEIDSEETFNALGYKWTMIQTVSEGLLALHVNGEVLSVLPQTLAATDIAE